MKEEEAMSISGAEEIMARVTQFDDRISALKVAREVLSNRVFASSNVQGMTGDLLRVADWILTGTDSFRDDTSVFVESVSPEEVAQARKRLSKQIEAWEEQGVNPDALGIRTLLRVVDELLGPIDD